MYAFVNQKFIKFKVVGNINVSLVRAELCCDTAADLPAYDGISGYELAQGSIAWDISTGDFYGLQSDGTWCRQGDISAEDVQEKLDIIRDKIKSGELPAQADALEVAFEDESGMMIMDYFADYASSLFDNEDEYIPFLEQLMETIDLRGQRNEIMFRGDLACCYARKGERLKYETICKDLLERYPDTHIVIAHKNFAKGGAKVLSTANDYRLQIFYVKTNSMAQIQKVLKEALDVQESPEVLQGYYDDAERALDEAKAAMGREPKEECPLQGVEFIPVNMSEASGDVMKLESLKPEPIKAPPKVGRNDPCPCGSGKKYKKCCGAD